MDKENSDCNVAMKTKAWYIKTKCDTWLVIYAINLEEAIHGIEVYRYYIAPPHDRHRWHIDNIKHISSEN